MHVVGPRCFQCCTNPDIHSTHTHTHTYAYTYTQWWLFCWNVWSLVCSWSDVAFGHCRYVAASRFRLYIHNILPPHAALDTFSVFFFFVSPHTPQVRGAYVCSAGRVAATNTAGRCCARGSGDGHVCMCVAARGSFAHTVVLKKAATTT